MRFLVILLFLTGCATSTQLTAYEHDCKTVELGMSRSEVEDLWGQPEKDQGWLVLYDWSTLAYDKADRVVQIRRRGDIMTPYREHCPSASGGVEEKHESGATGPEDRYREGDRVQG